MDDSRRSTAFSSEQYEHPYPDGIEAHYWTFARNRIVKRRLEEDLGGAGGCGAKILDIGCGRGITVDYLREHGFDAWGCEIGSPVPISTAVGPYLRVGANAFELDEETRNSVRCITLLDVLEHVEDPASFLQRCRDRFPGCKTVLVTLPARMEIWSNYDTYYGHFHRYDSASLKSMVPAESFEIVHEGYCFRLLYPPARLLSALGRERATEITAPAARSRWIHRLVGTALDLEERLLPGKLAGTSLLAVLHAR